jgi:hypothetical protein
MTSSAQIALVALLYARHGRGLIALRDLAECARALPNGTAADPVALVHALVAGDYLTRASERAWSLSPAAIEQIALADASDLSLTPDEERQLFLALQKTARGGSLDREDLHAVTRRFLEDVLAGAMIPDELLDRIVAVYRSRGRISMSEDGGRYTISM